MAPCVPLKNAPSVPLNARFLKKRENFDCLGIRCGSQISRDDSKGEICFVIRDLEKFRIFTEITILPFFEKIGFSRGFT